MRVLFIHQNMPGQFGRLAAELAADPANEVAFITRRAGRDLPGVLRVTYDLRTPRHRSDAPLGSTFLAQTLHGDAVVQSCRALLARGFRPDIIVGHPGWGELLFVKDLLPDVPLLSYCEFYHSAAAPFFTGDPPRPLGASERIRRRADSAHLLLALEAADRGWSPTRWQKSVHPLAYREKIEVVFDGVDTEFIRPDQSATFDLPGGRVFRKGDEVLTYAARALEPTRGFPTFYRALPELLRRRPDLQVLVAGDDGAHYDSPPPGAPNWKTALQREVSLDLDRVHFVGVLARHRFTRFLQVSSLHVYLTTPTVLSWSMVEAMSAGCTILASDTEPVLEMIRHEETGYLTRFSDPAALADAAESILVRAMADSCGRRARSFVEDHLSCKICLPAQNRMISRLLSH